MAALRGLLHVPRTAIREIKLIKTPTTEPPFANSNQNSFSPIIHSERSFFSNSFQTQLSIKEDGSGNALLSSKNRGWDVRTSSYHALGNVPAGRGPQIHDRFRRGDDDVVFGGGAREDVSALSFRRSVSTQPPEKPKSFMEGVFFDIKEEFRKNKEMKENLKKFRDEAKKLEESEALKEARQKFTKVLEKDSILKERIDELKDSEFVKKTSKSAEELGSKTTETVAETVKTISESTAFKKVSDGVKVAKEAVQDELNESDLYVRGRVYQPPKTLQKRSDRLMHSMAQEKTFDANENATEMVMHKDSKFAQSWAQFKENNQYVNKMFEYKMKYDESDHLAVRMSRAVTEKVTSLFGPLFSKTEMSEVMTEICKMDAGFDPIAFTKQCREDIIPNILEAIIQGNLEVLEDWCHEAAFNQLAVPIKTAQQQLLKFDARVLDITDVEMVAGKLMEQGPVLIITFSAQQILVLRDKKGDIVEGDPDKILRVTYVWALCRDQTILDPAACWRLIDLSASSATQWL